MVWQVILTLVVVLLVVLAIMAIGYHNRFVTLENRCDESWSNVDTELQRRHELIPNLVATVQGYAKHERNLFAQITEARSLARKALADGDHAGRAEAHLAGGVARLLAVAEAYPDLKASRQFLELQQELALTEDRIQAARRFYNGNVRDHRNATRQFPGTLFAAWFKPKRQVFFDADAVAVPKVSLT